MHIVVEDFIARLALGPADTTTLQGKVRYFPL